MEVTKHIVAGEEHQILRVAEKVWYQFHHFAGKDPNQQVGHRGSGGPFGVAKTVDERKIIEEGKIDKAGDINSIYTPGLTAPYCTVCEQTG